MTMNTAEKKLSVNRYPSKKISHRILDNLYQCDDDHAEVYYGVEECPVCKLQKEIDKLEEEKESLNITIQEMNERD